MLFYVHYKVSLEKTCSQSSCRALVAFSHIGHVTPLIEANFNQENLLWGAFLEHFLLVSSSGSDGIKSHVGFGVGKSGAEKSRQEWRWQAWRRGRQLKWRVGPPRQNLNLNYSESAQPSQSTVLPSWLGWTRGIHQRNYVIHKYYYEELILNANHLSPLNVFIIRTYFWNRLFCPYICS